MSQKIIMRRADGVHLFYCWGWDKWLFWKKLTYCFSVKRCRWMYAPQGEHLRKAQVCGEQDGRPKTGDER